MSTEKTTYYIVSPNGRMKLKNCDNASEDKALQEFRNHWTARANWSCAGKRSLVKTTTTEICAENVRVGRDQS